MYTFICHYRDNQNSINATWNRDGQKSLCDICLAFKATWYRVIVIEFINILMYWGIHGISQTDTLKPNYA